MDEFGPNEHSQSYPLCVERSRQPKGSRQGGQFKSSPTAADAGAEPLSLIEQNMAYEQDGFTLNLIQVKGQWQAAPLVVHSKLAAKMATPEEDYQTSYSNVLSHAVAGLLNDKLIPRKHVKDVLPGIVTAICTPAKNRDRYSLIERAPCPESVYSWLTILEIRKRVQQGDFAEFKKSVQNPQDDETDVCPGINCYTNGQIFWNLIDHIRPKTYEVPESLGGNTHVSDDTLAYEFYNRHLALGDALGDALVETHLPKGYSSAAWLLFSGWKAHKSQPQKVNFEKFYQQLSGISRYCNFWITKDVFEYIHWDEDQHRQKEAASLWGHCYQLAAEGEGPYKIRELGSAVHDWYANQRQYYQWDLVDVLKKHLPHKHPLIEYVDTMTYFPYPKFDEDEEDDDDEW